MRLNKFKRKPKAPKKPQTTENPDQVNQRRKILDAQKKNKLKNDKRNRDAQDRGMDEEGLEKVELPELKKGDGESTRDMTASAVKQNTLAVMAHTLGKKVPLLGAAIVLDDIKKKMDEGDYKGAVMEAAAGAVSQFPVVGTVAGLAMDVYIRERDEQIFTEQEARRQQEEENEKFRQERILAMSNDNAEKVALASRNQVHEVTRAEDMKNAPENDSNKVRNLAILGGVTALTMASAKEARGVHSSLTKDVKGMVKKLFGIDSGAKNDGHPELAGKNPGMGEGGGQGQEQGQDYDPSNSRHMNDMRNHDESLKIG